MKKVFIFHIGEKKPRNSYVFCPLNFSYFIFTKSQNAFFFSYFILYIFFFLHISHFFWFFRFHISLLLLPHISYLMDLERGDFILEKTTNYETFCHMDTNYETFGTWIQITRHGYKLRDFCNMDTNYETFGDTHWAPTNHLIRENVRNTRR